MDKPARLRRDRLWTRRQILLT